MIFTKHRPGKNSIFINYNTGWLISAERWFTLQLSKNINNPLYRASEKGEKKGKWYKVSVFAPELNLQTHTHTYTHALKEPSAQLLCPLFSRVFLWLCLLSLFDASLSQAVSYRACLLCNFQVCMTHCALEKTHTVNTLTQCPYRHTCAAWQQPLTAAARHILIRRQQYYGLRRVFWRHRSNNNDILMALFSLVNESINIVIYSS